MGINSQIIEFKQRLAAVINEAPIPITVKDMVLGELRVQLKSQIPAAVEKEKKAETNAKVQENAEEKGKI